MSHREQAVGERAGARVCAALVWRAVSVLALVAWIAAAVPARADGPGGPPESRSASRFGVVEAYYRPDEAQVLGVGWERIIFEWARFQPDGPGDFNTSAVPEEWLVNAQSAGREVVGLIKNTPLWASDTKKLGAPPRGLDLPVDDPGNVWAAFVRQVVTYYGAQWNIHHWIIYNEPDLRPGEIAWYEFDGDVADYAQMLKVAYLAAKAVDPGVVIHMAGMAWWTDVAVEREPYIERLFKTIAADPDARANGFYFDVATIHAYFGTQNTWNMIANLRYILGYYGLRDKRVWVNETNAGPSQDPDAKLPGGSPYQVSLNQQSAYIVQAAALSLAADVDRFSVYRLYDNDYAPGVTEPWGLVRGDGTRRPAFDTYRTVIETFGATTHAARFVSDRTSMVILQQPERTVHVLWARTATSARFYVLAAGEDEQGLWISAGGSTRTIKPRAVLGYSGQWFSVWAQGAIPDGQGLVMVEGAPVILVLEGAPRPVWVNVRGSTWTLRGSG